MRFPLVQTLRRLTQLAVILMLFGVIYFSLYSHYRAARALEDITGFKGRVFDVVGDYVERSEHPELLLDKFKGTLWSMKVGPLDWTDPLAGAEATVASKTIHPPLFLSVAAPVIIALLLGKVFCSWMCPGYVIFELGTLLRKILAFLEVPPANIRFSYKNKYIFLGVGLIFVAFVSMPIFALIYPPAVVSRMFHAWVFGTSLTGMLLLIGLILIFEVFVSPRWWCRTFCPGGALYGVLGLARLMRVRCNTDTCTNCGTCQKKCPIGLDPVTESQGIECDNCGACVNPCPERSLSYAISLPGMKTKRQSKDNS